MKWLHSSRTGVLLSTLAMLGTLSAVAHAQATAKPLPTAAVHEMPHASATSSAAPLPLSEEQRAILAVRDDGIQRVQALMTRVLATNDAATRRDLQSQITSIKFDSRIAELRVIGDYAQRRGDLDKSHLVADQIDRLLHPRAAVALPMSSGPMPVKGGQQ